MTRQVKQLDRHIESVLASLNVLDCFLITPKLSIKELVDTTGMTRNRVCRIIGTLLHKKYLIEAEQQGLYTTGPKLRALGRVSGRPENLALLVRPTLRQLALGTGESATFYVREGSERVVLAREEGTNAIRFAVAVGQRMELHAGAAGKVLLAHAPTKEQKILINATDLTSFTDHTVTSASQLKKELQQIATRGYSISKGERNPDAFAIAAPVFEHHHSLLGALSIAGPISRLDQPGKEEEYLHELLGAAGYLCASFGSLS